MTRKRRKEGRAIVAEACLVSDQCGGVGMESKQDIAHDKNGLGKRMNLIGRRCFP